MKKWIGKTGLVLLAVALLVGVNVFVADNPNLSAKFQRILTIGVAGVAYAETPDYECDGVSDNIQVQAALDALPATGGKLIMFAGIYDFDATVSRAIPNVCIEGGGYATYIAGNGTMALFNDGGQAKWLFQTLRTDAGGIIRTGSGSMVLGCWIDTTFTDDTYVLNSEFDANTILAATTDNTPTALTVDEQTLIGRETGGNITDLAQQNIWDILSTQYAGKKWFLVNPYTGGANTYKGQLHSHSTGSDGNDTPAALADAYHTAGYNFLAITDHDALTADPVHAGLLYIAGVEETSTPGHILNLWATGDTTDSYPQDILNHVKADGGLSALAHPDIFSSTTDMGWRNNHIISLERYQFVEIQNSYAEHLFGASFGDATEKWDAALTRYIKVWGIGADDCHDISDADIFNKNWVIVNADSCTSDNIKSALRGGNFYVSNGADVVISVSGNVITATTGAVATITFKGDNGTTLQAVASSTTSNYTTTGNERYIRVEIVRDSDGKKAWSQPVFVVSLDENGITYSVNSGATLPTSPEPYQLFLHTPVGRKILYQYSTTAWIPILSLGSTTMYVDVTGTTHGDNQNYGYSSAVTFNTVQFAVNQIPGLVGGNVIIYIDKAKAVDAAGNTYAEAVTIQGKSYTGAYSITINGHLQQLQAGTADTDSTTVANVAGSAAIHGILMDIDAFGTDRGNKLLVSGTGATTHTGTASSTSSNCLVSIGENFASSDVGKLVKNTTDGTYAIVTEYSSATTLVLSSDIFVSGENYSIYVTDARIIDKGYTDGVVIIPFTSGNHEPAAGDIVKQDTSDARGVVVCYRAQDDGHIGHLNAGTTWAGSNATADLIVVKTYGTFDNSHAIDLYQTSDLSTVHANNAMTANGAEVADDDRLATASAFTATPSGDEYVVYSWGTTVNAITVAAGQVGIYLQYLNLSSPGYAYWGAQNSQGTINYSSLYNYILIQGGFGIFVSCFFGYSGSGTNLITVQSKGFIGLYHSKVLCSNGTGTAIYITGSSSGSFTYANVIDGLVSAGVYANYGIRLDTNSTLVMVSLGGGYHRIRNCDLGLSAETGSMVTWSSTNQYSGNVINTSSTPNINYGQAMVKLDLSGAAQVDVPILHTSRACTLVKALLVYTEASSADAGVTVTIGSETDNDYYYTGTSEASKAIWYELDVTLLQTTIAAGNTVVCGHAGTKTGTGEILVCIEYYVPSSTYGVIS